MFEKFLSGNAHDFRQRYEGTFGFYTVEGERKFLALLERIDPEDKVAYFRDVRNTEYSVNADITREIGFEFLPPTSAFYNTVEGVTFLERVAARQFKRGVCSSNMRIYTIKDTGFTPTHVNFKSLLPVYGAPIPYKDRAEEFKAKEHYSMALSPTLMVNPTGLYIFKEKIGSYDYIDTMTVSKRGKMFITEINDALRSCGLTEIKVVLNEKA